MPAIAETEADQAEVVESDTEVATEDGEGDPDAAEPLAAYAVLMA
ncbi:hypothetical protein DWB77_04102 [Streptomyces hundungensis]|uniref:Uncharacterized protein n=1 Tax=Streptomyces hundungensis TaxID=1077946 RepID=A0A387HDK1_9ACTN|nr:hypothetical protein [Streptomyces hundungensis]AYG81935.1 hypothetical protein DWB77_04102 [Streptomyces hundungensis]